MIINRLLSASILVILLVASFVPLPTFAQTQPPTNPFLIEDVITAQTESSNVTAGMPAGLVSYFFAKQAGDLWALWKTDGTANGATLVKSGVQPGGKNYAVFNGFLYYPADDGVTGRELWRTDLATGQTELFRDMYPGIYPSEPHELTVFEDRLYFAARWSRLQSSDGTVDGTPINGMQSERLDSPMVAFHNSLYYAAYMPDAYGDNPRYYLAWFGSGGSGQTTDLIPGSPTVVYKDRLYFTAKREDVGWELWSTGGTLESIHLLRDINPGAGDTKVSAPVAYNGLLYFTAQDSAFGQRLWQTDGSEAGTIPIFDLPLNSQSIRIIGAIPPQSAEKPGGLLLSIEDYQSSHHLWVYNGAAEPQLLADLGGFTQGVQDLSDGIIFNSWYYFPGYDAAHGAELWKTDGSVAGTARMADLWPGPRGSMPDAFAPCGTRLCFSADDGVHGQELWGMGDQLEDIALVADLNLQPASSYPQRFTPADNLLYFFARDNVALSNLWRTDGTTSGTLALNLDPKVQILPGWQSGDTRMASVGTNLFFTARDPDHGEELWISDGSQAGTQMVSDIWPGVTAAFPDKLIAAGDRLFFTANDPEVGWALWVSDGTQSGTTRVFETQDSSPSSYGNLIGYKKQALFTVFDNALPGCRIWHSDGTPAGTNVLLEDYCLSRGVPFDGKLYFSAYKGDWPETLWSTDGTPEGTKQVAIDLPAEDIEVFENLTPTASGLYFTIRGYFSGSGKVLYRVTPSGVGSGELYRFYESNSALVETAGFGQMLAMIVVDYDIQYHPTDYALWTSDGTAQGTHEVRSGFSKASTLMTDGTLAFFSANEPDANGIPTNPQIWRTDGTEAGTRPISAYAQRRCEGMPYGKSIAYHQGLFLLSLEDSLTNPPGNGCELWAFDYLPHHAFLPAIGR